MSNASHLFADRVINLTVTGPMIRIEFGALQPPAAEGQKPAFGAAHTLVMPLDGFIASVAMMETVIKKLVDDGVITRRAPAEPSAAPLKATS